MVFATATAGRERGFTDDSDRNAPEGVAEQLERVANTASITTGADGSFVASYTDQVGHVRTISSRKSATEKSAGTPGKDKQCRVTMIAVFATLGSVLFGLDIGYIGPIIESVSFKHDVAHIDEGSISSATEGLIVSLFSIGAMVTASPFISSYFLDEWGRKNSIMVGSVLFILGSLIQGTANGQVQMLIGRFVAGMSIGLLSAVITLYQSELAPPNLRGALSTLYQMGITFGILLAAYLDQMLVERNQGWRMIMAIICIPAVGLLLGMAFLPRSPRWLVQKGRRKEALQVLLTIRT